LLGLSLQKCEHCRQAGATIPCRAASCPRLYHLPCAAASGCFQSTKTLWLLCPEHLAEAAAMEDARCSVCNGPGDLRDLVLCTGCGQHCHGACLDVALTPCKRSGWQCPECKVCQTCRQRGQDSLMLVCEACDKGYHTFCLGLASEGLPAGSWRCKSCQVCADCGWQPPGLDSGYQWSSSPFVCESCQRCRVAEDPPVASQPDPPAQTLAPPDCREPADLSPLAAEPEPVGCDKGSQLSEDPKEPLLGDGGSPRGEMSPAKGPPSKAPHDELPHSDVQPLEEPPHLLQPLEEPPPLMQPPEEPPQLVQPPPIMQPLEEPPDLVRPPEEPPDLVRPPEEPPDLVRPPEEPPQLVRPPEEPP
ncbi:KMT2D methyltransferase, partial [Rhinopomastus cyanomelas]|nr:KMT2D methyltransferase [Rhinopomastus cyanomelas]